MDLFRLRKDFGAIVFGEEEMIDCGSHLNAEPFSELFVLDREVLKFILSANLSKELGKAVFNSKIISTLLAMEKAETNSLASTISRRKLSMYTSSSLARCRAIS